MASDEVMDELWANDFPEDYEPEDDAVDEDDPLAFIGDD